MAILKRNRSKDGDIETLALANCLMLLSRVGESTALAGGDKLFSCKTCDRKFSSFQALGGHRASHKMPKLVPSDLNDRSLITKPSNKSHDCSICGQEFAMGQALGGHMKRHRTAKKVVVAMPVLKKSSSGCKRVLSLDLKLSPFENDVGVKSTLPSWLQLGVANHITYN